MEEEIVFIAHIKKEPPVPEWPREARNSVSDSDSGTGRSSQEIDSVEEEDDDVQIIKPALVYPEFSLKLYGRQNQVEDRRASDRQTEFPNYDQLGESRGLLSQDPRGLLGQSPRGLLGQSPRGLLSQSPLNNWVRKELVKVQVVKKKQRAPPSRFRLSNGKPRKSKKFLPEFHGKTDLPIQPVSLLSEAFLPDGEEEKSTGWFERNLVDMGRSVSAPPFIQPQYLCPSPTPSSSDDGMEIVEALVHSGRASREEEFQRINPLVAPEKTTTVVFRGLSTTVTVPHLEAVCTQNNVDWVGQIRLQLEESGLEQFAQIQFLDHKFAEKLARFCDGRQLEGAGNRVRCFVKGTTTPGFKSDYQWNCAKNRKRSWTECTLTHEELNKQLEEYKKNGVRELTERERMNPTRH